MVRGKARDRRNKPKPRDALISTLSLPEDLSLQDNVPPTEELTSVSQETPPADDTVEFLQDIDSSSKDEELSLSTDTISDISLTTTESPTMAVLEKTLTTTVTSSYQSAVVMMKRKKR